MKKQLIDGHIVRVGNADTGPGLRTVVDGEDVTEEFLLHAGSPPTNGHWLRIPRSESWAMLVVETLVKAGELP